VKYYNVEAVNADGTPNNLKFDHVSEWSLKGLTEFFGSHGVVLKPAFAYSVDDKPLYYRDIETGELKKNTGQVL
jgi:hypothetical protein